MLTISTNCTCYLLTSHLPNSYPLNAHTQYQEYLLPVTSTPSQQLPSQCSLSVTTVHVTCYLHTFPTATLSMLTLSTNCTCYLLPSHLPNNYPLNAHSQYQLYLQPLNFTLSQQLPSQCSLSIPTVLVTCYLHTFPTATLSMLTLSSNCTCYLLPPHLPSSHPLNAHTQYQLYLLPVTFTPSQHIKLPSQYSPSIPTVPLTFTPPNSYPLNAHSQYQLYLLLVTFKPSEHIVYHNVL